MNVISTRSKVLAAIVFSAVTAGSAWAGSGCIYSSSHDTIQAKVPPIENADVLADVQNTPDPKWLALIKRRELASQVESGTVVVPN